MLVSVRVAVAVEVGVVVALCVLVTVCVDVKLDVTEFGGDFEDEKEIVGLTEDVNEMVGETEDVNEIVGENEGVREMVEDIEAEKETLDEAEGLSELDVVVVIDRVLDGDPVGERDEDSVELGVDDIVCVPEEDKEAVRVRVGERVAAAVGVGVEVDDPDIVPLTESEADADQEILSEVVAVGVGCPKAATMSTRKVRNDRSRLRQPCPRDFTKARWDKHRTRGFAIKPDRHGGRWAGGRTGQRKPTNQTTLVLAKPEWNSSWMYRNTDKITRETTRRTLEANLNFVQRLNCPKQHKTAGSEAVPSPISR